MRAVNLVPDHARRGRGSSGVSAARIGRSVGPAHVVVGVFVIVVALILLRVLAVNDANDNKATLAAVQAQVATEQTEASNLSVYATFVEAAQQRENQVRAIAEQRFPWKRSLDQISRVMPATTSLTSLSATTVAATTTSTSGMTVSGPTFTLAGCADTPDQNGTATLLRRLGRMTGVTNVGFQSSTRASDCGNSFNLALTFGAPAGSSSAAVTTSAAPSSTATQTTATATPTATTSTGAAG